jgi:hypothetical protein
MSRTLCNADSPNKYKVTDTSLTSKGSPTRRPGSNIWILNLHCAASVPLPPLPSPTAHHSIRSPPSSILLAARPAEGPWSCPIHGQSRNTSTRSIPLQVHCSRRARRPYRSYFTTTSSPPCSYLSFRSCCPRYCTFLMKRVARELKLPQFNSLIVPVNNEHHLQSYWRQTREAYLGGKLEDVCPRGSLKWEEAWANVEKGDFSGLSVA